MPTSVDDASFPQLVQRFQLLIDLWTSTIRQVFVQELVGAGPVVLSADLHGGKSLLVSNYSLTAPIVLELPADAPIGTVFLIDQVDAAPVRLSATGAVLRHRLDHNGTAGQWASISARCIRAGVWLLSGDTGLVA